MPVIAVDGPAAAGKGSLSRHLAAEFGLPHLDTGMLYRIVALDLLNAGQAVTDAEAAVLAAARIDLGRYTDAELRARHMGEAASVVSAIPELRLALLQFQVDFAARDGGAVLDGRDIGTVICPDADLKLFVTASPSVRARRRTDEILRRGEPCDYDTVLADIIRRDERDSSRGSAPLAAAADAHVFDTTDMGYEEMKAAAVALASSVLGRLQPAAVPA